jgi:hypothetical protein
MGKCIKGDCVLPPAAATDGVAAPGPAPNPGPQTTLVFSSITPGAVDDAHPAATSYSLKVSTANGFQVHSNRFAQLHVALRA